MDATHVSFGKGAVATATRRGQLTHQQMRTGDRIRYGPPSKNAVVSNRKHFLLRNLVDRKLSIRFLSKSLKVL